MLTQYLAGVFALSAATAFIFPPPPTKADPPAEPTVKQLLEDIKTQVTGTRNDIAGLKDRIDGLDRQIVAVQSSMVTTTDHERLKKQLEQLRADVESLRAQMRGNSNPVTAGSSPLGVGAPGMARPAPMGTLRVTNQNFFDTEVFVNGVSYVVGAFSNADIPVPVGAFTYSVPTNMAGARTRVMPAGQVFGITIH